MELIISAILMGFLLSFVLIGPVFFLVIETSLSRGFRAAIFVNLGVLTADIIYILLSYYSSSWLLKYIEDNPYLYKIAGLLIFFYGLFIFLKKEKPKAPSLQLKNNYLYMFFTGLFLNLVNIGVLVFWLTTVILVSTAYKQTSDVLFFFSIVMASFFLIDLIKITLAKKLAQKLTDGIILKIKRILGFFLMICGLILFFNAFFSERFSRTKPKNVMEQILNK